MNSVVRKAEELEKQIDKLAETFELAVREREEICAAVGMTDEKIARFEGRLSPEDRKNLEKQRDLLMAEIGAVDEAQPERQNLGMPPIGGIRV